jgi:hypothetical protein
MIGRLSKHFFSPKRNVLSNRALQACEVCRLECRGHL